MPEILRETIKLEDKVMDIRKALQDNNLVMCKDYEVEGKFKVDKLEVKYWEYKDIPNVTVTLKPIEDSGKFIVLKDKDIFKIRIL